MNKDKDLKQALRGYLAELGRKGGKKRAAKYDRKTLSEWAKLGGRPRKKNTKSSRKEQ